MRRLSTPKQWRAAITNGELERDTPVTYEAPGKGPVETVAGDCPELAPLFDSIVGPAAAPVAKPAAESPKTTPAQPKPVPATPAARSESKAEKAAPGAAAAAAPVASSAASGPTSYQPIVAEEPKSSRAAILWIGGAIAIVAIGALSMGGGDDTEPNFSQYDDGLMADADAALEEIPDEVEEDAAVELPAEEIAPTPTPSASASDDAARERRATPSPTPTPTPTLASSVAPAPDKTGAPARSLARPAQPDNQGRWARQIANNYPSRALRAGEEGSVGVSVVIGSNGRVATCSVTSSSGSSTLDDAACDGMRRYARFNPALNADGSPTRGTYATAITYRMN